MADIHDRLRHRRIAQHASVRREKSQVSETHIHSSHVEVSTSMAHASPSSSSSSRKRYVSPTDASLSSYSCRRQVSPIQALETPQSPVVPEAPVPPPINDASKSVPPPAAEADELVPPLNDEVVMYDEINPHQEFGGGPVELSMLPLYPDHVVRHILNGEDRDPLKIINHGKKIIGLPHPNEE
ncbi:unnamed protein product [Lathyrus oleraceus]